MVSWKQHRWIRNLWLHCSILQWVYLVFFIFLYRSPVLIPIFASLFFSKPLSVRVSRIRIYFLKANSGYSCLWKLLFFQCISKNKKKNIDIVSPTRPERFSVSKREKNFSPKNESYCKDLGKNENKPSLFLLILIK